MSRRGRRAAAPLLLAFVVVPVLEIYVLIQVGQVIGPWWTILLLVLDSILGTWLIKREGRRAWLALREQVETGRMPHRELADGALIVLGGALMLSPGFVTDALGILLILPVTVVPPAADVVRRLPGQRPGLPGRDRPRKRHSPRTGCGPGRGGR